MSIKSKILTSAIVFVAVGPIVVATLTWLDNRITNKTETISLPDLAKSLPAPVPDEHLAAALVTQFNKAKRGTDEQNRMQ